MTKRVSQQYENYLLIMNISQNKNTASQGTWSGQPWQFSAAVGLNK